MTEPTTEKPLSPAHYEAIGHVIVSCSALQHILSFGAFSLAVNDGRPWEHDVGVGVLTMGMSAQTLVGTWRTLVRIRAPKDADAFDKLADDARLRAVIRHTDLVAVDVEEDRWAQSTERVRNEHLLRNLTLS